MAENSNVVSSVHDINDNEVIIIDVMLLPPLVDILQAIRNRPKLKYILTLIDNAGGLSHVLRSNNTDTMCFKRNLCVKISEDLNIRMEQALNFNQFTFMALSDNVFDKINQRSTINLSPQNSRAFLRRHMFVGILSKDSLNSDMSLLAQPVDCTDIISILHDQRGYAMVTMGNDETYRISEAIRVKEGMLMVLDSM